MTGFAFIGGPLNGQIIETGGAPDWRAPIRKPVSLRMAQARADIPPFKDGRFDRVDASERPYDEFIYLRRRTEKGYVYITEATAEAIRRREVDKTRCPNCYRTPTEQRKQIDESRADYERGSFDFSEDGIAYRSYIAGMTACDECHTWTNERSRNRISPYSVEELARWDLNTLELNDRIGWCDEHMSHLENCLSLHVAVSGPAPTENTQSGEQSP